MADGEATGDTVIRESSPGCAYQVLPPTPSDIAFAPPEGGYSQRLKQVMALGQPKSRQEQAQLVATLGDENGNIRWLAGSSLVRLANAETVTLLAAYLAGGPPPVGAQEARRVLGLIAETASDEAVRQMAGEAVSSE